MRFILDSVQNDAQGIFHEWHVIWHTTLYVVVSMWRSVLHNEAVALSQIAHLYKKDRREIEVSIFV